MQVFKDKSQVEKSLAKYQAKFSKEYGTERRYSMPLRYRKRTGDFVGSNVGFDPIKMHATSYRWWDMVRRINGLVVFNDYGYSMSTRRHQSKVRSLMRQLGIKIDLEIEARKGLQDLGTAIADYEYQINELIAEIQNPRSRKDKNLQRAARIRDLQAKVKTIKGLMKGDAC